MSEAHLVPEIREIRAQIDKMHRGGQLKKAIELCQSALKADPTNPDLHIRLGDLYIEWHLDIHQPKQYVDEAITQYQRALEANLDNPVIHYKVGVALYHKGELDKAFNQFKLCIECDDRMSEAYFMLARTLTKKANYSEALPYLEKAIHYGGLKTSRAHYLMYLLLNNKIEKSFVIKIKAFSHLVLFMLALIFDKEAKREFFTKLSYIQFLPIFIKGYYLEKTRNVYRAIELYSQAIEETPRFLPLYILLGDVYRSIGKISDAINEYRMALWLDSTSITAYKSLCSIYEEQSDYDSAIEMYRKLIHLNPNDAVFYSNLANLLYLKGKFDEAISAYQTAVTLNPNKRWTSVIAQTLGYIFQESKENVDAAISSYQNATLLNPEDLFLNLTILSS